MQATTFFYETNSPRRPVTLPHALRMESNNTPVELGSTRASDPDCCGAASVWLCIKCIMKTINHLLCLPSEAMKVYCTKYLLKKKKQQELCCLIMHFFLTNNILIHDSTSRTVRNHNLFCCLCVCTELPLNLLYLCVCIVQFSATVWIIMIVTSVGCVCVCVCVCETHFC
jgi:hypothetical protein